jgi:N-acyl amino acid synthase of PEP-CTERM/exosortase system
MTQLERELNGGRGLRSAGSHGNSVISTESTWDRYFEVKTALTPGLLDEVYALRYQVYCVEHAFEDPAKHPTGRETDRHDPVSQHVALVYRSSGEVVGTTRLILPLGGLVPSLPLLSLMGQDAQAELRHYPLEQMAEISRYAISKSFRRRKCETEFPDVGYSPLDAEAGRRSMPHLTLGLMRGIHQLGVSRQVHYLCGCMRPALLRLLRQLGLEFKPIGPLVSYHGFRQPCVASIDDLLVGLKACGLEL